MAARRRTILLVHEGKPHRTTKKRRFYWTHVAGNGEIDARSQAYTRRFDAERLGRARFPKSQVTHEYPNGARVRTR